MAVTVLCSCVLIYDAGCGAGEHEPGLGVQLGHSLQHQRPPRVSLSLSLCVCILAISVWSDMNRYVGSCGYPGYSSPQQNAWITEIDMDSAVVLNEVRFLRVYFNARAYARV
jgi:hypothetical protein